jgi:hypothetical protein
LYPLDIALPLNVAAPALIVLENVAAPVDAIVKAVVKLVWSALILFTLK